MHRKSRMSNRKMKSKRKSKRKKSIDGVSPVRAAPGAGHAISVGLTDDHDIFNLIDWMLAQYVISPERMNEFIELYKNDNRKFMSIMRRTRRGLRQEGRIVNNNWQ